jgi:hypothetical protein
MKKIYLLVAAIIYTVNVNAQTPGWVWAKGIGGQGSDGGHAIATDGLGNIYTTGIFLGTVDFDPGPGVFNLTSIGTTFNDAFVCKTDTAGNFIWAKALGGSDADAGRSIAYDASGSGAVYISGSFRGTADFDPGAGTFNLTSATSGYTDIFICKLDPSGNFMWAKAMGGAESDDGSSITIDPSGTGNIYCTGYFRGPADFDPGAGTFFLGSAGSLSDIFVSKYDGSGNFIWAKQMGGAGFDWGLFIAKGTAGSTDVYTTGYFSGTADFDPSVATYNLNSVGLEDIFVSKLDSSGNFVWAKAMGGKNGDYATAIATDISGNVYTTGHFRDTADLNPGPLSYFLYAAGGSDDIFISKLDGSGNFVWAKGIGGTGYDSGIDIIVDADNLYTIGGFNDIVDFDPGAGVTNLTSAGNVDIYISRLDTAGNFVWVQQAGGTNGDNCHSLAFDAPGNLYVAGTFSSDTCAFSSITITNTSVGQSDLFIAKLDAVLPTGIETISDFQSPISIFPNPTTGSIQLTFNTKHNGAVYCEIINVMGERVYEKQLQTLNFKLQTTLDVSFLARGIYLVRVGDAEHWESKKLVVE